jgi:uncharacterized protein YdaT
MPWTGPQFASRHNQALSGKAANSAARQANVMLRAGVPEGEAIATANKHAERASSDQMQRFAGKKTRSRIGP